MSEGCTLTKSDKSWNAVIDSIRFIKEIFHTCFVNWIKYFIKKKFSKQNGVSNVQQDRASQQ